MTGPRAEQSHGLSSLGGFSHPSCPPPCQGTRLGCTGKAGPDLCLLLAPCALPAESVSKPKEPSPRLLPPHLGAWGSPMSPSGICMACVNACTLRVNTSSCTSTVFKGLGVANAWFGALLWLLGEPTGMSLLSCAVLTVGQQACLGTEDREDCIFCWCEYHITACVSCHGVMLTGGCCLCDVLSDSLGDSVAWCVHCVFPTVLYV